MKVLFIYPNVDLNITVNHGIASLSAFLKRSGHQTDLIQINTRKWDRNLSKIEIFRPHFVAMYVSTTQWEWTKAIASDIKRRYSLPIFIGGPHPTVCPDCLGEMDVIDGLCIGEGELVLLELVERIGKGKDISDVQNLCIREGDKIIKNSVRPLIENINELPFSDWDIFSKEAIYNYPCFTVSRGCPFNCSYCINHTLKNIYSHNGRFVRIQSVEKVIDEIRYKKERFNLKMLNFDDDVFTKDKRWIMEFCCLYREEVGIPFNCNVRMETIDYELCLSLKDAGANMIGIGIECGDYNIRKKVLNRAITDKKIIETFRMVKEVNLKTYAFNMIGIPGESRESFTKTIALNRVVLPDDLQLSIFFPFPGTVLGDECRRKNYIREASLPGYFGRSVLESSGLFNSDELYRYYDNFEFLVYKDSDFFKAIKFRISKFIHRNYFLFLLVKPFFWIKRWIRLKFYKL